MCVCVCVCVYVCVCVIRIYNYDYRVFRYINILKLIFLITSYSLITLADYISKQVNIKLQYGHL